MSENGAALADPARTQNTAALKCALMGLAGASIEWYDFLLYGTAAALVFPTVFFPATLSPFVALIASFSSFAVGFVARPAGAVLLGHMGDRVGRKTAFAVALIVMGTATTLIGVLPSYHTAGVFSPLALVLLRFAQGLAVGGQWGGAILLATENAPQLRRGLYGGIAQAGVPVGSVLANLAFLATSGAMSSESFMAYGWRIPFLFSLSLVGLGVLIYFRVEDTAAFRQLPQSNPLALHPPAGRPARDAPGPEMGAMGRIHTRPSPVLEALRLYPKSILLAAGAYTSTILSFYLLITYVVAYGTSAAGLNLTRTTMLAAVLIGTAAHSPITLLAGALCDRYGRRRIFMTGVALTGAWAFILFPLIETRSFLLITVAIGGGLFLLAIAGGPVAAMFAELFDTHVRYSAVSLAYQIAAMVGGGLAPVLASGLYARYHSNFWISVYMAAACAMSLFCASMLKETHGTDLDRHSEPAVA